MSKRTWTLIATFVAVLIGGIIMTHTSTEPTPGVRGGVTLAEPTPHADAIKPFRVHVSDEALADLKRRVLATRWPEHETVADQSQGVPLAMMRELVHYWATDYDWRKAEAKLNA